ncbi:hypothetical protein ACB098_07G079200 [Castanea mollissima]
MFFIMSKPIFGIWLEIGVIRTFCNRAFFIRASVSSSLFFFDLLLQKSIESFLAQVIKRRSLPSSFGGWSRWRSGIVDQMCMRMLPRQRSGGIFHGNIVNYLLNMAKFIPPFNVPVSTYQHRARTSPSLQYCHFKIQGI